VTDLKLREKIAVLVSLLCLQTSPSRAVDVPPNNPCLSAIRIVASETQVPIDILFGISLTESGRAQPGGHLPWPWAFNQNGKGHYFESQERLMQEANKLEREGHTNFDVGCFQINYRWHRPKFPSLEAMTDPISNARYAASFLSRLKNEFGTWDRAIGAYHSRTHHHANRYRAIVARNRDKLPTALVSSQENPSPKTQISREPNSNPVEMHVPELTKEAFQNTAHNRRLPLQRRRSLFE